MGKKLEEYSREELIEEIKSLKKRKKFGLVWEDKKEDIVEKCKNEIPVLKEVPEFAINERPGEPTNLIIEGDNFASLQVLNYTHHGKIDVIYIDPPYNTGNKDFIYNDSYVDSEDSFRHSKWLSFMDRRLRLAKELLSNDGVIFISINNIELFNLKLLCDSVFDGNMLCNFIWKNTSNPNTTGNNIAVNNEYILCYARRKNYIAKLLPIDELVMSKYTGRDEYLSARGPYTLVGLNKTGTVNDLRPNLMYDIEAPDGSIIKPNPRWRWSKEKFERGLKEDRIVFNHGRNGWSVYYKQYFLEDTNGNSVVRGKMTETILDNDGRTTDGANELSIIVGKGKFDFPKPTKLIKKLLLSSSDSESIVLDFFAGSGTTGQAVLELNKEDGGNRRFILCTNNESNIARDVTYPRIKTVVTGIRPDGLKYSDGIPANVRYFTTDFIEKGITGDATRAKLFEKSDEMIQVRENTFELVDKNDNYIFYKNNEKFVAIIKDPFNFGPIWYELEEKNTEKLPVKLYVFSYSNYTFEDEIPDTDLKYEICAIPNSVMEVYRKISDKKEERQ